VQHWKAEARRYRAEQESQVATPFEIPSTVSADVIGRRQKTLAAYRHKNHLTVQGLAHKAGMSEDAIRGIVKENRKKYAEATRDRLLKTLGISLRDWYEP